MYDATFIYSSPMQLCTGEDTDYCHISCIWKDRQGEEGDVFRFIYDTRDAALTSFYWAASTGFTTPIPPVVLSTLWDWFQVTLAVSEGETGVLTSVVEIPDV